MLLLCNIHFGSPLAAAKDEFEVSPVRVHFGAHLPEVAAKMDLRVLQMHVK
jgi:hypothetical protein